MANVEFVCVFVRAAGERLVAAERLVLAFPQLFAGALDECDVAYRVSAKFLVTVLRFAETACDDAVRERLAFWAARAGGRASPIAGMTPKDLSLFRANFDACDLKVKGVKPAAIFDAIARLFTDAGAPAARPRSATQRTGLSMDVGGPGWEGASYDAKARALFVAAPVAPPVGDEFPISVRVAGSSRLVAGKGKVVRVRRSEEAQPGKPAGYTLEVAAIPPGLHAALAAHAPAPTGAEARIAPRFPVRAPVKISAEPSGGAGAPAPEGGGLPPAPARSTPALAKIEYATEQELQADFVENLSQGGAFVRTPRPSPVGTAVALSLRLPNGADLEARAIVAFVDANGMGVRFTLDAENDAVLAAAIAQISARPRRALVVDDDALQRRILGDALAERGFEVITAANGAEGLRTLSDELLALDLLVTDVKMPEMDGETFVRIIRNAGGETDLAIVAITGRIEPGLEKKLELAGADAVLDKALGGELVAQAADAVLERKRIARERG